MFNDNRNMVDYPTNNVPTTKLRITRPNGTVEIIEVRAYKEYRPQDLWAQVPNTVNVGFMVDTVPALESYQYIGIPKSAFLAMVLEVMRLGQTITAIRLVRAVYPFGLKDAKDLVEYLLEVNSH